MDTVLSLLQSIQSQQTEFASQANVRFASIENHLPNSDKPLAKLSSDSSHIHHQLHLLQNPLQKFHRGPGDLPREICIRIMSLIHFNKVFNLRRLSTAFNELLQTKQFAIMLLRNFSPFGASCCNGQFDVDPEMLELDPLLSIWDSGYHHVASEFESLAFLAGPPPTFQSVYAELKSAQMK
ncbi:hypothetical protein HDU98_003059, partial [Podochytrium sp. JEL0797]